MLEIKFLQLPAGFKARYYKCALNNQTLRADAIERISLQGSLFKKYPEVCCSVTGNCFCTFLSDFKTASSSY